MSERKRLRANEGTCWKMGQKWAKSPPHFFTNIHVLWSFLSVFFYDFLSKLTICF
jgi:hypothetical protein